MLIQVFPHQAKPTTPDFLPVGRIRGRRFLRGEACCLNGSAPDPGFAGLNRACAPLSRRLARREYEDDMRTTMTATTQTRTAVSGKYLTICLGSESYAVDALNISEIIRSAEITAVPQMPAFVKGAINLRGKIIPGLDLRLRFGWRDEQETEHTCIVVVQAPPSPRRSSFMGLVVNGVEEVDSIAATDIEETPGFETTIPADYLLGMAKSKRGVESLMEIDKIVGGESLMADTLPAATFNT
jgi:purine-binding chemotaxis protein CheW